MHFAKRISLLTPAVLVVLSLSCGSVAVARPSLCPAVQKAAAQKAAADMNSTDSNATGVPVTGITVTDGNATTLKPADANATDSNSTKGIEAGANATAMNADVNATMQRPAKEQKSTKEQESEVKQPVPGIYTLISDRRSVLDLLKLDVQIAQEKQKLRKAMQPVVSQPVLASKSVIKPDNTPAPKKQTKAHRPKKAKHPVLPELISIHGVQGYLQASFSVRMSRGYSVLTFGKGQHVAGWNITRITPQQVFLEHSGKSAVLSVNE